MGKYAKNHYQKDKLPESKQRALNYGAILATFNGEFWNSLATGANYEPRLANKNSKSREREIKKAKASLTDWWGIDSRESAIRTMDELRDIGHRSEFKPVLASKKKLMKHDNLQEALPLFIKKEWWTPDELVEVASVIDPTSWDMGRLVNVVRWCFSYGYISEEEAWGYIEHAAEVCGNIYEDWADFANGYVIGRAMWGGLDESLEDTMDNVIDLLADDESPWVLYPLSNDCAPEEETLGYVIDDDKKAGIIELGGKNLQNVSFFDSIPPEKLERAKKAYAFHIGEDETVICLYDDTDKGSGKEGFILTSKCVHSCMFKAVAKKSLKDSDYLDYIKQNTHLSNIQRFSVKKFGWLGTRIISHAKSGAATELVFVSGNKEKGQAILNFLNSALRLVTS